MAEGKIGKRGWGGGIYRSAQWIMNRASQLNFSQYFETSAKWRGGASLHSGGNDAILRKHLVHVLILNFSATSAMFYLSCRILNLVSERALVQWVAFAFCVHTGESSQESSTACSIPTPSASGDETSTPEQGTPGETTLLFTI